MVEKIIDCIDIAWRVAVVMIIVLIALPVVCVCMIGSQICSTDS